MLRRVANLFGQVAAIPWLSRFCRNLGSKHFFIDSFMIQKDNCLIFLIKWTSVWTSVCILLSNAELHEKYHVSRHLLLSADCVSVLFPLRYYNCSCSLIIATIVDVTTEQKVDKIDNKRKSVLP